MVWIFLQGQDRWSKFQEGAATDSLHLYKQPSEVKYCLFKVYAIQWINPVKTRGVKDHR